MKLKKWIALALTAAMSLSPDRLQPPQRQQFHPL